VGTLAEKAVDKLDEIWNLRLAANDNILLVIYIMMLILEVFLQEFFSLQCSELY